MADAKDRKLALIRQIEEARSKANSHGRGMKTEADIPAKFRSSFQRHRLAWMSGSAVAGILLARWASKPKKTVIRPEASAELPKKKPGLLFGIGRMAFDLGRPVLMAWASRWVTQAAERHMNGTNDWEEEPAPRSYRPSHRV